MSSQVAEWFVDEVRRLEAERRLDDEPNAWVISYVDALIDDDEDFYRWHTGRDPRATIAAVARSYKAAKHLEGESAEGARSNSWRQHGYAFKGAYAPTTALLQGKPDPTRAALLAFLWPFADFFCALDAALQASPSLRPSNPPWCHRLREVGFVVMLSEVAPGAAVSSLVAELLQRKVTGRADIAYLGAAFEAWCARRHPLRRYTPKATCELSAARCAINRIMQQIRRGIQAARRKDEELVPRQTRERWRSQGIEVSNKAEVERARGYMRARRERQHEWPSQALVARALRRPASMVSKYRREAERLAGVEAQMVDDVLRYPPEVVRALHDILASKARRRKRK